MDRINTIGLHTFRPDLQDWENVFGIFIRKRRYIYWDFCLQFGQNKNTIELHKYGPDDIGLGLKYSKFYLDRRYILG